MNQELILQSIPHRAPFLFVDEVVELTADTIVATHRPGPDTPYFRGHFPGKPVMPGVLICEACFQAGAILVAKRLGDGTPESGMPVVTRIGEAKFKRMVRPGDTLRVAVSLDEELGGAFFMSGKVTVEGKTVLRVKFAVTLTAVEEG